MERGGVRATPDRDGGQRHDVGQPDSVTPAERATSVRRSWIPAVRTQMVWQHASHLPNVTRWCGLPPTPVDGP